QLSTGQKQRVGIARALILKPKLLIADEPISHLDVAIQMQILNLLKDLKEKHKLSYLFVAHDLKAVRYIANRVAVMYLGKILETASCESLFTKPVHPYTIALLASSSLQEEWLLLQGEPPSTLNPPSGCRFHPRCPVREQICFEEEPKMVKAGREHFAACHFV
ncbi:MAG: ABC transporter ATP-binding protein, partial [Halobacteria archaeon]